MPEGTDGGQAPPEGTENASGQEPGNQPQDGTEGQQELTPEQAAAELARARREAAQYRTQLRDAQGKLQQYEQAQMSEQEKAQARIQELERQASEAQERARATVLRAETTGQAARLGFHNPTVAHRLLEPADIEWSAEGEPTNVEDLLRAVLKDNPYLARQGSGADGGAGREGEQPTDMNATIRRMAGRG